MGRGRQKAKATRQAREMKYFSRLSVSSVALRRVKPPTRPSIVTMMRMITRRTQRNMQTTTTRH